MEKPKMPSPENNEGKVPKNGEDYPEISLTEEQEEELRKIVKKVKEEENGGN